MPDLKTGATAYYQVADHLFAVQADDSALFSIMTNYEPFKIELSSLDDIRPIFALSIHQYGLIDEVERTHYQHVCTDQSEEDMPRIEVYKTTSSTPISDQGGWLLRVSMLAQSPICCEVETNFDFTSAILHISHNCKDIRFCIDNALMLVYAFRTASLKTLEMHAAVVVRKGQKEELGYLFLGHSGTGKSTHARQWLQAFPDAVLLNDDNPILRIMDDGQLYVYGSPWSGKTPCYRNESARVGGIVKLSQAPANQITRLSLPQALAYMLSSASGLKMDAVMADNLYQTISHIVTHFSCHHLACLPNTDAAIVCYQGLT